MVKTTGQHLFVFHNQEVIVVDALSYGTVPSSEACPGLGALELLTIFCYAIRTFKCQIRHQAPQPTQN